MDDPTCDIHDWEVVLRDEKGELESLVSSPVSAEAEEGGVIRSDYFTLDAHHHHHNENDSYGGGGDTATANAAAAEGESTPEVDSDNPSWVDPSGSSFVNGCLIRKRSMSPNSNSNSSSESSDRNLLSLIEPHSGCGCGADLLDKGYSSFEHLGCADNLAKTPEMIGKSGDNWSDTGGNDVGINLFDSEEEEDQPRVVDDQAANMEYEEGRGRESEASSEEEKQRVVWWKVPLEVLRYCVLRVSPVWSLSVAAAAVMGLVLLRRRYLYKLKRKSQGIQLKVTLDDKKISQFMSRAARLNEAFSVVKRVPIIRPAMPAPGMAPWPVVSMR